MANTTSLPPKTASTMHASYHGVGFVVVPQADGFWFVVDGGASLGPFADPQEALTAASAWIDRNRTV